jgi:hypothetical protein
MTGAALTAANNAAAIIIRYIMILWFLFQIRQITMQNSSR